MADKILLYEELSLNAWPSLQTQFYDGWILRYTNGYSYTSRANSVNLLYPSVLNVSEKLPNVKGGIFHRVFPLFSKRQGVSRKLLGATKNELSKREVKHFHVLTGDKNIVAQTLYMSCGYVITSEILLDKN